MLVAQDRVKSFPRASFLASKTSRGKKRSGSWTAMVTAEDAFRTHAQAVVRDYFVEPRIGALR
jgi:hypothetical protein